MYGQGVTRGKVAILGIEAACNQACAAINPIDDELDTRYCTIFFRIVMMTSDNLRMGASSKIST